MDELEKNKDTQETGTNGSNGDGNAQTGEDAKIQIDALKDLLKENAETIKSLKEELQESKKMNAKMVAILDVSKNNTRNDTQDIKNILNKYGGKR